MHLFKEDIFKGEQELIKHPRVYNDEASRDIKFTHLAD